MENSEAAELEKVLNNMLTYNVAKDILVQNALDVIEVYYKFLKMAIDQEKYEYAAIIHQALQIENRHYKTIGRKTNHNIDSDMADIHQYLKEIYLDIY